MTGEPKASHDLSCIVFTVLAAMSGMEREYIRDRTLEGHESARKRGKTIGGAGVTPGAHCVYYFWPGPLTLRMCCDRVTA
ncbi:recombinase family protein [Streptomyces sp. NPDC059455]|uniref:recombinase family protein n=1 Tax=Streptomyces sp. NPDC059455 TaxID=3346837 RepID=UPI00368BB532